MPTDCISYQSSGYFTPIMRDYLEQKQQLQSLYNRFPTLENFGPQIDEKALNYDQAHRKVLVSELEAQYANCKTSAQTATNIGLLQHPNTFTITTGHQLNLFTGPLYFLYKIISAINLAKQLKQQYPENDFVPVYWMATEDHDFEEINYFNFKGRKFRWNRESAGAVGRLSTEGLDEVFTLYAMDLGDGTNADKIRKLFSDAYLNHDNLTDATRYLANELFGDHGLVILDADKQNLKRLFIPQMKQELLEQLSNKKVSETIEQLSDYQIQVNPREINLFYLDENLRERIIKTDNGYAVNNTAIRFTIDEILTELQNHPEKFSPNVVMRPLYEEVILPNLCYIGGGGEIAYWLELKSYFDASNVTFPILLLRNSALLVTEKQSRKADRLNLSWSDLFLKNEKLINEKTKALSEFPIDLTSYKQLLQQQFGSLYDIAKQTDKSFTGAVKAQETKQINGLNNLEKRLLKAQKRKHGDTLRRITDLQHELFPFGGLQERQANFSEFFSESGEKLIQQLLERLDPLRADFTILVV